MYKALSMSRLTIQTADTVHPDAKDRLLAAQKNNGFLPNLIGVLANAPTALETSQVVGDIHARTGLTAADREVAQINAATRNDCGFYVAANTALARKTLHIPVAIIQPFLNTHAFSDPTINDLPNVPTS